MKKFLLHFFFLSLSIQMFSQLNMELASQIGYTPSLNDVWGWSDPDNGDEYAIVGMATGVSIVNVTDPYNANEVVFLTGVNSTWRDIKTWDQTAYVSNETGDGIMVIDLSQLPATATASNWIPDIPGLNGNLWSCHNLFIDENGIMYPTGCGKQTGGRLNAGGAIYVDVATDQLNPSVIGWGPSVYSHDIYTRGDTMYASEIYEGQLAIYDITDKSDAKLLGSQNTPFNFTHNAWLSDNGKVVFTTDERGNAPVAAYDISDMDDIQFLDEYRPLTSLSTGTIPHNVHVWDDYLIISYYTDGGRVVDASRPTNLIEVGNFDSFFGGDGGFSGVWGAYPFLPSGTVLLSDRQSGLVVCVPKYVRACWLEGSVTEKGTGINLNGVDVQIENSGQANLSATGTNGKYETGQAIPGDFIVTFQKAGYRPKAIPVTLENGVLVELDVELEPLVEITLTGIVTDFETGDPISGGKVVFEDYFYRWETTADNNGAFEIPNSYAGEYEITGGYWGYKQTSFTTMADDRSNEEIELKKGYEDDFALDLGWQTAGNATEGLWEKAVPSLSNATSPATDLPNDIGTQAFVTGNTAGTPGTDDVDNGNVILTSPEFDLTNYSVPILNYNFWFVNTGGTGTPNDSLIVKIQNGTDEVILQIAKGEVAEWQEAEFKIEDFISPSATMRLVIETADNNPGHIVEAAIDGFKITESDTDGDGYGSDEDCDEANSAINPGATEIPNNNIDEDCDGVALIIDVDMDGFNSDEDCDDANADINPNATEIPNNNIDEDCDGEALIIDVDMDGFNSDEDCDDANANINPNAVEIPNNNIDEDCDGVALIIDVDMDGFNSDEDCDDANADINPNATEIPNNNIDEDCDGVALIIDVDMDGFNSDEDCDDANADINPNATEIPNNNIDEDCDGVALIIDVDMDGFNSDEDCDDANADINPNATEIPNNNIDEDCDGVALIIDVDMDGFNSDEDCDDANAGINPNATEIPNNNIDEDCDGIALIIDVDMDGFNSDEDCDDANANINPNAVEIPNNNIDEDCDGVALIIDVDMDGFNSDEDCDDANADINPNATEIPNNNIDEDCDGEALVIDDDMDGFNSDEDCDDANSDINPNATEIPNNNIDEDCDGFALVIDDDMDGFNSDEDCDDTNADINPNATEIPNNNIDEDCDGEALIIDVDMDGFNSDEDCDDANADINPNATEIPNNDIDEDCDGEALIIDVDMDGFNSDEDCDDANADINPNAIDIPNNGIDENCDGMDATSSTIDIELSSVVFYPNPFKNGLNIRSEQIGEVDFQVFDLTGRLVFKNKINLTGQNTFVKLNDLNAGIYTAQIRKKSGAAIYKKLIKVD